MFDDTLMEEIRLQQAKNEVAALAVVVRREAPTSGKPGDKALITANGTIKGWIGGGCTRGIIIKEALEAIEELTPRLVRVQPSTDMPESSGVKNYKMTCMSGGSVEVYIEPLMPVTKITVFGRSHIAKALCEIGHVAGFSISVVSNLADDDMFPQAASITLLNDFKADQRTHNFVVVCTQGDHDTESLRAALDTKPKYISFVASRKKANSVLMTLKREGVPHEQLVSVKTPAGLDIQAKTPQEVAISILAEIIQVKRQNEIRAEDKAKSVSQPLSDDLYINPVCKIPVQKSTAKHVIEYNSEKVYFCCDGCKDSFEKEPEAYL